MEKVRVYVNVPQKTITKEDYSITITENNIYRCCPTEGNLYKGTGNIIINVNVPRNIV
jgi:hypothetical protein